MIHSMDVGLRNLPSSPWASLVGKKIKNLPARQENQARALGLGRSPGEGNGFPLWRSCPENPMDRVAWVLRVGNNWVANTHTHTAAATKWLQSWLTLCDPMDGSPPGSPVSGILQARTLEWVAVSVSNE